jgi:hypothetical protein
MLLEERVQAAMGGCMEKQQQRSTLAQGFLLRLAHEQFPQERAVR